MLDIERNQKVNEFRNISFNFLVRVFNDYGITSDNTPFAKGDGIDNLTEDYRREFINYRPFLYFSDRRKYRKYIRISQNHKQYWQELVSVNTRSTNTHLILNSRRKLIKEISRLGRKLEMRKDFSINE